MLPTTSHVQRLFFSPQYPNDKLEEFTQYLAETETMIWVLGLIPKFVDFRIVVQRSIVGLGGSKPAGERIMILAGELDMLMDVGTMHRLAKRYRDTVRHSMSEEKDADVTGSEVEDEADEEEAYTEDREDGVRMVVIKGAGHHIQNDLQWEVGAERVADFLQQL